MSIYADICGIFTDTKGNSFTPTQDVMNSALRSRRMALVAKLSNGDTFFQELNFNNLTSGVYGGSGPCGG
jgi:hypothetical protein